VYRDKQGRPVGKDEWRTLHDDPLYVLVDQYECPADPYNWHVVTVWEGVEPAPFATRMSVGMYQTVYGRAETEEAARVVHGRAVARLRAGLRRPVKRSPSGTEPAQRR
jgi:hypothetical protein